MERILIVGSGPVVIGQGMEFDYAGTQAVLAYQKMGHKVVVLNSNPASIMSDLCQSYHVPMTVESILEIIDKEAITALAMSFGGQTALNLALELEKNAEFLKRNIKILGTKIAAIRKAEDRDLFKQEIMKLGYQMAPSQIVTQENIAAVCNEITDFPVIIRPAYTLGGYGGGRCKSRAELPAMLHKALQASKIKQAILEADLTGLTELEFEVISDASGLAKVVLDLENIDPVGVHTGDSHVVAPIMSLPADKVLAMKKQAETIAAHFQIIGSCNVQMAYDEKNDQVYVIEMNPRVSRSSALASKISSYPIAEYTAYLSLGQMLSKLCHPIEKTRKAHEIKNLIYPAFKAPIWPFDLMPLANRNLGTQMKSVGEAMAMSNHLEGAMHQVFESISLENYDAIDDQTLLKAIEQASDQRLASLLTLIKRGYDLALLSEKSQ
ncbi:MAG TPA: carbamoyl-phosphate synthase large subunit, partial [Erysipelothrix sp.]